MSLPDRVRAWLNEETAIWTREGLIGEAQRERILARYPEEAGSGRMAFILRAMGLFTIFAAILLVIGHNWEDFSRAGRMGIVVGGLVIFQSIGLAYALRDRTQGATLGLLASCLMYGAAIALTGQIFHLDAHAPDALLAWCLGTLPFALLLDATLLHLLVIKLAAGWYIWELGERGYWRASHELTIVGFLLLLAPSAWAGYRKSRSALVGFAALGWLVAGVTTLAHDKFNPAFLLAPLAITALHHPGDPRSRGWRVVGLIPATVLTIALGFFDIAGHVLKEDRNRYWIESPLLTIVGGGLILLGIWKARDRHGRHAALLAAAITGLVTWRILAPDNAVSVSLIIALGNVLTLALALTQARLGLAEGRLRPYVYGCSIFMLWLLVRYADINRDLGYLGMAAVLTVIGLGLFALARLWRSLSEEPVTGRMSDYRPAVVESWLDRIRKHARPLLIAGCVAQVAVIGYMVWNHLQPLWHGERIVVRAELVDPRDFLKGDYVTLSYDFNSLSATEDKSLRRALSGDEDDDAGRLPGDTVVFVPLVKQPNGEWIGGKPTLARPSSGLYLQGLSDGGWRSQLRFGIEAFYIEEGKGAEWEKLRNSGLLKVTIAVLPNGQAGLVGLEADKAPFVELKGWRVLRGWKPENEWRTIVVDTQRELDRATEKPAADADPAPDLAKERVVVIGRREGPSLKVESNGNVTRILTTHQAGKPADENEGVVIAIPRNHQKVFGENGRRLADADPMELDAPMDR